MPNDRETGISLAESRDLRRIAAIMIPANEELGVPSADDTTIFTDIVRSLGRDLGDVRAALAALCVLVGSTFADAGRAQAEAAAEAFLAGDGPAVTALSRAILQCYYRDDRVLRSLGHEPRSPFPKGHVLEQGDWSLLDAVKGRPRLWRDDRGRDDRGRDDRGRDDRGRDDRGRDARGI
jgi:hypothetical protein